MLMAELLCRTPETTSLLQAVARHNNTECYLQFSDLITHLKFITKVFHGNQMHLNAASYHIKLITSF